MLTGCRPFFVARPLSVIRLALVLLLLIHVAAFSAAAQGTSLELIEALPDTDTLHPGDAFFAQFKVRVINPPQFGGIKMLVESEGADFIAPATSGEAPGFTSIAENGALNWDANNIGSSSLPLSIPAVSCEFGGFCPSEPQTLEQSLLKIPTALRVTAIAIERTFAQDGTVTETEVARLLVKTYDIEKPASLTLGAITGQSLNTRQKVFVTVPGARFDEAEGITVRLLRSNDINLSRFADFFPGGDFTCPEQPFRNTFGMCGLEVVSAQQLSFTIDAFLDEARAQERNILGSYDT